MYAVTNRIKVQMGHGSDLEEVFGKRGGVEKEPGFKSFELWRLDAEDEHEEYLVVTRWESKDDFKNWTKSDSFKEAHSGPPAYLHHRRRTLKLRRQNLIRQRLRSRAIQN